jgi:predicted peptidase
MTLYLRFYFIVINALLGLVLTLPAAEVRTWTSSDGRTLEAEFVTATQRNVTLRRKSDGRRFVLALDKISEDDRKWVAEALEAGVAGVVEKKEASGIFEDRLTEDWERMEFESLKFRFYGGRGLNKNKRYPVVVFLHGKGSGGSDNEKHLRSVPRMLVEKGFYRSNPSFVIAPQCPDDGRGWRGQFLDDVLGLVKQAIKHLPVDKSRIYITGLSMGGFGTWSAIAEAPGLFAAAVPVCGGGDPRSAKSIKDIPIWAHHGVADDVVPVAASQIMVTALEGVKGSIRYTEYDKESGIKHNAWTPCYGNPEVFEWMFSQRQGKKKEAK